MPYANFNQTNFVVIVGGENVSINGSAPATTSQPEWALGVSPDDTDGPGLHLVM